jgi:hypothetical protein
VTVTEHVAALLPDEVSEQAVKLSPAGLELNVTVPVGLLF